MDGRAAPGWARWELAYCGNVHPAPDLGALLRVVREETAEVRRLRGLDRLGAGLWVGADAARTLAQDPGALVGLREALARSGLTVFTLNGFPYGDFHQPRVKEQVYRPDWSEPRRLSYTLDLARLLADLLPPDRDSGTLSTLPLGFGPDWDEDRHRKAVDALHRLAEALDRLRQATGKHIRVCLEMEPDCVLERTDRLIEFFRTDLATATGPDGHLGVCFDVCHQAVMFEHAGEALGRIADAGIPIGKIQISSALELPHPAGQDPAGALAPFAEPRYLHQVRTRDRAGRLAGAMDLPQALEPGRLPCDGPWRVHFHVPIQANAMGEGPVTTTRPAILDVLDLLAARPDLRPHLEVETYSWQVLPGYLRPQDAEGLRRGLTAELTWLESELDRRGLIRKEED